MKKIYKHKNDITTAFVCFYNASKNNFGASKISFNFFINWNFKEKKLFQFSLKNEQSKNKMIKNITLLKEYPVLKILKLPILIFYIYDFLKNKKKPVLIIEGASWVFYSFLTFFVIKFLIKNIKIIYHGHNVEYKVRNKTPVIKTITYFSEKYIYKKANIATVVSNRDKKLVKSLYKINPYIFLNGYCLTRNRFKRKNNIKLPKKFVLFNGSYSYWPNKIAIDNIFKFYYKKILIKNNKINFVFTGHNFPEKYKYKDNVIFFNNLNDNDYKFVLKKAKLLFLPLPMAPGTKVKVIEALCEDKFVVASKSSFLGIKLYNKQKNFIYKNRSDALKKIFIFLNSNKKKEKNLYKQKYIYKNIVNNFLKENREILYK